MCIHMRTLYVWICIDACVCACAASAHPILESLCNPHSNQERLVAPASHPARRTSHLRRCGSSGRVFSCNHMSLWAASAHPTLQNCWSDTWSDPLTPSHPPQACLRFEALQQQWEGASQAVDALKGEDRRLKRHVARLERKAEVGAVGAGGACMG